MPSGPTRRQNSRSNVPSSARPPRRTRLMTTLRSIDRRLAANACAVQQGEQEKNTGRRMLDPWAPRGRRADPPGEIVQVEPPAVTWLHRTPCIGASRGIFLLFSPEKQGNGPGHVCPPARSRPSTSQRIDAEKRRVRRPAAGIDVDHTRGRARRHRGGPVKRRRPPRQQAGILAACVGPWAITRSTIASGC